MMFVRGLLFTLILFWRQRMLSMPIILGLFLAGCSSFGWLSCWRCWDPVLRKCLIRLAGQILQVKCSFTFESP